MEAFRKPHFRNEEEIHFHQLPVFDISHRFYWAFDITNEFAMLNVCV